MEQHSKHGTVNALFFTCFMVTLRKEAWTKVPASFHFSVTWSYYGIRSFMPGIIDPVQSHQTAINNT